jgi:ABC-2 type transport system permease protein
MAAPAMSDGRARLARVRTLVRKEWRQMIRDPASIAIGVVLPVILILLFGYGLSLDVKNVPLAVLDQDGSALARGLIGDLRLSPYFKPSSVTSLHSAEQRLAAARVEGILTVPPNFAREARTGRATLQLIVSGTDANTARIIEAYVSGAVAGWASREAPARAGPVGVQSRLWFNAANDSRFFLVPGLIVLVMTLIGAFLTAMVVAREWERGTFEALFVTPVRAEEILLGKTIPYFALGMVGLALCVLSGRCLFHVPVRGSLLVLLGVSMLYVLVALAIGLLISSAVKNQLVASQLTLIVTFMPATMLSGLLFDLRSMPAPIRAITYVLPARYYVALLQTIFLAGDIWTVIVPNALALLAMLALFALALRAVTRKRLA